jgi:hypothetical protein
MDVTREMIFMTKIGQQNFSGDGTKVYDGSSGQLYANAPRVI